MGCPSEPPPPWSVRQNRPVGRPETHARPKPVRKFPVMETPRNPARSHEPFAEVSKIDADT